MKWNEMCEGEKRTKQERVGTIQLIHTNTRQSQSHGQVPFRFEEKMSHSTCHNSDIPIRLVIIRSIMPPSLLYQRTVRVSFKI